MTGAYLHDNPEAATHTSRAGDETDALAGWDHDALTRLINLERRHIRHLTIENHRLADLLDGVMQDDPQAIRDAAAWLAANRPEVDG